MYQPEFQVEKVVTVSTDGANEIGSNAIKISNVCSSTAVEQVHNSDSSVAVQQQQLVIDNDILKLCTSLTSSANGGDDGPKIIYVVQTDNEVKTPSTEPKHKVSRQNKRSYSNDDNDDDVSYHEHDVSKRFAGDLEINKHRGFLLEIAEHLDDMTACQQMSAKIHIMQVLYRFKYGNLEQKRTSLEQKRITSLPSTTAHRNKNNFLPPPAKSVVNRQVVRNDEVRKLDCDEVQIKLDNSEFRLVDVSSEPNCKSRIWQQFMRVYDGKLPLDFVACNSCRVVYRFTSTSGTGELWKHKCETNIKFSRTTKADSPSVSEKHVVTNKSRSSPSSEDLRAVDEVLNAEGLDVSSSNSKSKIDKSSHVKALSRDEVTEMIASGELILVDESGKPKCKSLVWDDFYRVYDGDIPKDFVACKYCEKVYAYSSSIGTTNMIRHKCRAGR